MARNGSDVLTKKYSKLESFLKRNLDVDTFERIRTHEACIVCSEKEDKVYKFVVLSDERIYLTENPPKKISVEKSVNLRDVVSVELLNEYPEFLNGRERENTLHIVVKHRVREPLKTKRRLSDVISGRLTPRTTQTSRTSRSDSSESASVKPRALPIFNIKHVRDDVEKSAQKLGSTRRHNSSTSSSLGDDDDDGGWRRTRSCKETSPRRHGGEILTSSLNERAFRRTRDEANALAKHRRTSVSSDTSNGPLNLLPRQRVKKTRSSDKNGTPVRQQRGDSELHLHLENDDDSDGDESDDESSVADRNKLTVPSSDRRHRHCSSNSLGSRRSSTNEDPFDDAEEEEEKTRETMLHLYIPDHTSPLLMLIQSAWNSCIIRATLEEDEEFCKTIPVTPRGAGPSGEQLETSFCELKSELLNPRMPMEELFNLVDELNNAAERRFTIKKLFWKTQELFAFVVAQLQKYLPKSPKPRGENDDEARSRRADEFEYVILLVETLQNMLHETDILTSRMTALKAENGKLLHDLVVMLTCFAELPQKYVPPSRKAQALLNSVQSTQWKCIADMELSKLVQEYNNAATATLYELILIAHQVNWGDQVDSFFNVNWLVKELEKMNTTERFVEKLISHAIRLISPSRFEELQPAEAVLIYKQFHVLRTLVDYSAHIVTFIRNNFYEEFKYYIQAPVIRQKLPKRYLIHGYVIKVMERVMAAVLQRKVTLLD
ncbi:hypothetical protein NP493_1364g00030 [Ridgeia piscesae]|uniref:Uncharacterized protein n=1 Tax=Ridgeia piscesae TaxID=27915 RepID=A0AAD9NCZ2_RIDPI|nr:hypothetical protein NP493_1364g00030 [Ridgeia piscesae]